MYGANPFVPCFYKIFVFRLALSAIEFIGYIFGLQAVSIYFPLLYHISAGLFGTLAFFMIFSKNFFCGAKLWAKSHKK